MATRFRYPDIRMNVAASLESLADPVHQRTRWGVYEEGVSYYDDLTLDVNLLYDYVLPDPTDAVGIVITEEEAEHLRRLDAVLGPLIDKLGNSPDSVYLAHERWPDVVSAAAAALECMQVEGYLEGSRPAEDG